MGWTQASRRSSLSNVKRGGGRRRGSRKREKCTVDVNSKQIHAVKETFRRDF